MKKVKNIPIAIELWLSICVLSLTVFVPANAAKNDIIYEYKTITQKKGEPFSTVLKKARLSEQQKKWVSDIPIYHNPPSKRQLRFAYLVENKKRLLKEIKVTRGNRRVNFVLTQRDNTFVFVQKASEITNKSHQTKIDLQSTKPPKITLQSAADKPTAKTTPKTSVKLTSVEPKKVTPQKSSNITLASAAADKVIGIRFSQAKGQSLESAMQVAKLSALQQRIVNSGDFTKAAKSHRHLTLYFQIQGKKRLLKGLRVTRNKNRVDYAVKKVNGQFTLVNLKTLSDATRKRLDKEFSAVKVTTLAAKPINLIADSEDYSAIQVNQYKGQSLKTALKAAKLSPLQQRIVDSGDFIKSAKSTRQLTVYFSKDGKKRLMKGFSVARNKNQADYVVKKVKNQFRLVNLKTLNSSEANALKKQFTTAKVRTIKTTAKTVDNKKNAVTGSINLSSVEQQTSGNYQVISITQKKGQTLYSALKAAKLSSTQRNLVIAMPATQSAKTTRRLYLLLEGKGNNKYLRALRIVRDNRAAEYVLTQYKGKWTWANEKGQIQTAGDGSFSRYPVRFTRVSSPFNLRRRHPVTRRIRPHKGIDLKAAHGTPIHAPAGGVVVFSGRQRGYGIVLEIDHQNGYHTKYAHLSRIMRSARKGNRIKKGQLIAKVGNTGISTGAHLHYEVIVNGRHRNPATVHLPGGSGGGMKTLPQAKTDANRYLPTLRRLSR